MATGLLILAGVERPINDYRGRFGRRFRICCCPRRWWDRSLRRSRVYDFTVAQAITATGRKKLGDQDGSEA